MKGVYTVLVSNYKNKAQVCGESNFQRRASLPTDRDISQRCINACQVHCIHLNQSMRYSRIYSGPLGSKIKASGSKFTKAAPSKSGEENKLRRENKQTCGPNYTDARISVDKISTI